jgi:lupus La protein
LRGKAAQNEEGYVPLTDISAFKRVVQLTSDLDLIKKSLENSSKLQLNSDKTMVKRIEPLPSEDPTISRSIYCKGLVKEGTTIEDVQGFFSKYGKVLSVRLRKQKDAKLKPSAFVEFDSEATAEKVRNTQPPIKNNDQELIIYLKREYYNKKKEARKEGKDSDKKDDNKRKRNENNNNENAQEEEKAEIVPGKVLKFKGIGADITAIAIKDIAKEFGDTEWVDLVEGETREATVRFSNAEIAEKARSAFVESKRDLGGVIPEITVLSGEEEKQYYEKMTAARQERRNQSSRGGKGGKGGRGGRGGRGKKRGKRF